MDSKAVIRHQLDDLLESPAGLRPVALLQSHQRKGFKGMGLDADIARAGEGRPA